MKRYPRRASVSTKIGASADSPNASRNRLMAALRLWSKSTKVSAGQSLLRSSSLVTTSPGLSSSAANTWKGCSWSFTFCPCWRSSPVWRFTSNVLKWIIRDEEVGDTKTFAWRKFSTFVEQFRRVFGRYEAPRTLRTMRFLILYCHWDDTPLQEHRGQSGWENLPSLFSCARASKRK